MQVALGAVALFVLVVGAAVLQARLELDRSRRDVEAAQRVLTSLDTAEAGEHLDRAVRALDRADRRASLPPVRLASIVPVVGSPARAVTDATDAGRDVVAAARLLADAAARFPLSGHEAIDGHDLRRVHDAADRALPALDRARDLLARADARLGGPSSALLPPVSSPARHARQELRKVADAVEQYRGGLGVLADLTDATESSRLLVVSQDPMELRPTGGYIGSYGVLHFEHGTVDLDHYAATEDLPPPTPRQTPPPDVPPVQARWTIEDTGWWPDFPTSAAEIRRVFALQNGGDIDGVVALTEDALARVIGVIGPITVPGYEKPVTEEGFAQRVLYEVELKRPLDTPRKNFLIQLSDIVFDRLFNLPADQVPGVARALGAAAEAGDVQVWFADGSRQAAVRDTRVSGRLPDPGDGDYLSIVDANFSPGKANADLYRYATYTVRRTTDGALRGHLEIVVRNDGDRSAVNPYYASYLRVYAPLGAKLLDESGGQIDQGRAVDGPYQVFGRYVHVLPHEETTVVFEYELPPSVARGGYHLRWDRQPGTERDALTAVVNGRRHTADAAHRTVNLSGDYRGNRVVDFLRSRWLVRRVLGG